MELPYDWKIYDKFHSSVLKPYVPNDDGKFPDRTFPRPEPVIVDDLGPRFTVAEVKSHHARGRGFSYLVRWLGYPEEENSWVKASDIDEDLVFVAGFNDIGRS